MTDFAAGALCTFSSPTMAMVLQERGPIVSHRGFRVVDAATIALVIRDFCDMTLVCVDGHVGWVYKCWIAEAKDVR